MPQKVFCGMLEYGKVRYSINLLDKWRKCLLTLRHYILGYNEIYVKKGSIYVIFILFDSYGNSYWVSLRVVYSNRRTSFQILFCHETTIHSQ
jgi:hypothetical protein